MRISKFVKKTVLCEIPAPSVDDKYETDAAEMRNDDLNEVGPTGQNVRCEDDDCEQASMNVLSVNNDYKDEVPFTNDRVNTDGDENEISCTFNRRGICDIHKLKGDKKTIVSKKWTKRKFDYGWVTSKKTVYTCMSGFGLP